MTIAQQGASSGQILKWNGATWLPADHNNWGGDNWGTQTATTNAAITGDGTVDNPLDIAAQGAAPGQVLKWNGTSWLPQDEAGGDGWGNQVAATSLNIIGDGTAGQPLRLASFNATSGQVLSWNPMLGLWMPADDTWGTQTAATSPRLTGNGTSGSPLDIAPQNAAPGQVLKFNGTTWVPQDEAAGDDWGAQVAITNTTLTGNGTAANPLNIAQQGATIGQILKWNGVAWTPASNSNTLLQDTDGNTRVQVEKNANEDIIRFDLGGTESMVLRKNESGSSRLELPSTLINTFVGNGAGTANTTGSGNTANGVNALFSNTTGSYNTANGAEALFSNTTGFANTANGANALYSNTTGTSNTATGFSTLRMNTTGNSNTANGNGALFFNTTGSGNTANGVNALRSNTTGYSNTANGDQSLYFNTTGNQNTANGWGALTTNTTGNQNTANGSNTLFYNTTGGFNTANGANALNSNTTGSYNTALGYGTNVSSESLDNATAIGSGAWVNASNKVRIGNSAVTVIEGQVDWTFPSDARFKYNVHDDQVPGLAFIKQLRPVTYQFDARKFDEHVMQNMPDSIQQQRLSQSTFVRESAPVQTGFLAQEVERACRDLNFTFSGLHVPENNTDNYGLAYASFVPLLVKAIQEQQELINAQQTENAQLRQQLNQIQSTFEARLLALEKARIEVTPAHASPEK
ncbi:MAG: tail fiber domain-containing protein [Lewinellaceae bacterium]|nr:tail fiber domain-containing protein [Lewinellaceae bacterium]